MMGRDQDAPVDDDELLPRLFQALGPRPALPDDLKRGWEATFSRELAAHNARRRQRRWRYLGAACAAAAGLAIAATLSNRDPPTAAPIAQVVATIGQNDATLHNQTTPLRLGEAIFIGATIHTSPGAYLALQYRDAEVRLDSNTVVIPHPTRLQLVHGALYVDVGPPPNRGPALTIETAFGTLTHVGTQFVVSASDTEMRVAVREGAIAMNAGGARRSISATDGAREALVSAQGTKIQPIAAVGGPWQWVVAAAPGYPVDGASADAFLAWAARQLGAELSYADDATRVHARLVTLHGDMRVSVAQGLAIVDAATDLTVDRSDAAHLLVTQTARTPR
jgi:ferric-dicitrate binding protein FerR (iron transport regulator)